MSLDIEKKIMEMDLKEYVKGFEKIAKDDINRLIIYPVHLNPKEVQQPVNRICQALKNIVLINPLAYEDFIWLMNRSKIIITDSGGVQEEALV